MSMLNLFILTFSTIIPWTYAFASVLMEQSRDKIRLKSFEVIGVRFMAFNALFIMDELYNLIRF